MGVWLAAVWLAGIPLRAQALHSSASQPLMSDAPPARPAQTGAESKRVVAIRIIAESGAVLEENPSKLPLQPGQPLEAAAVRESLRALYRTGRYADLRAELHPAAGGVQLDFVVRLNFFVNLVRAEGLREPPGEPQALAALRLGLGEMFRESELAEALERLQQSLRDNGLYQAMLGHQLHPNAETRQMDILVRVTPGLRARLGAVALHNSTDLPDGELLEHSKLRPGREVTLARLDRAAERMRKLLVSRGHLGSRITIRRGEYDAASNTVPLAIDASAGPRVRLELAGAKIPGKQLRKMVPVYQEGTVDEDLLQEGRRNIRDYLEREGYFGVLVQYAVTEPARGERRTPDQVVAYQVTRGERHRLVGIAFDGNKYFSDDLLRSRLGLVTSAFASRGRFSHRLLQNDVDSLHELYVANGFRQCEVRSELQDNYQGKHRDLFVRVHIKEGPQTLVSELKLEGNRALRDDDLLPVIGSTVGQPYSEFNVSGDRDNILALYYNEGFPEARFTAQIEEAASRGAPAAADPGEAPRVRLIYRLVEGPQIRVAHVLFGGYEHTRPGVVQREVSVKAGEPLREGEVVETQRGLYNLGIFSRVLIAPQNPAGSDPEKTMVVLVEEGKRYTLGYGGGIEVQRLGGGGSGPVGGVVRASPRAIFEISKANVTGRADTLSFKARGSTLQGRALASYTAPNVFSRPSLSLQLTAFADKTRDILTFTSRRYEGSVQLAQRLSLTTSLLYRYAFRHVLVSDLHIKPDQIQLFNQPTKVSALGLTWVRERRNDPADASRGAFNNVDLSVAGKPIGSSASFARLFVQNSTFHPLGRRFVFARSARFGVQTPLGNTLSSEIPLPELFFAGGGQSLRGFGLNQAGPRDPKTGFPVGGQAMLIFNQEFRFPMRLPFVGSRLGGALFYDAGNVFSSVRRITLRPSPPSPDDVNYFSHTLGIGFHYRTPIGPVRVDLAYQLNAACFSLPAAASAPRVPGCAPGQARLPRFQFFFNLGSIF